MTTPIKKLMLAMAAALALCLGARAASNDWMVVDIKTGEVFYHDYDFATATNTFSAPVYKTEKMAFRRIPAGLYHIQDGTAYAFIRYDYYLSIFPVTVGQHASMTNRSAKVWAAGQYIEEMQRAQHNVSWRKWRGTDLPSENDWISNVGEDFWANSEYSDCPLWELDKRVLRATHDVNYSFDFPTRAMWEVAARAMPAGDGSHKTWKWFWGETIDGVELYANTNSYYSSQKVGSRLPNDWGFYDIYGTCWEWCQDGEGAVPVSSRYAALYEHSEWPHMPDADDPDRRLFCGSADSGASYSGDASKNARWIGARIAVLRYQECSAAPVMITFKNETGETLQSATEMPFGESVYAYSFDTGSYIYYKGPRPTKAGNAQYYYTFSGWDQDYAISNAVVTAVFERHVCNYAVNWVNWDGSQLISNDFDYGDLPYYPGATPTKPSTVEYEYTFTGWNPEPAAVTGETTYVAQFVQSARKYDITWLNYDGSTNATSRTPYNTTPEFEGETPAKPSTVQYAYTFAGWTPELEPATSNIAYTAKFDAALREYTISWRRWDDDAELFTTNVPYGSTPVYLCETPTQPSNEQYDYVFAMWHKEIVPVTGATTYYARFKSVLRSYDITWLNYDGTVLCVTNVPYGATPAYTGATPTKPYPADPHYGYSFTGWTPEVSSVTGTTTYTANFVLKLCDWMVVDLRTGLISEYAYDLATATNTFNTPLYKTKKMVFRRVPEGLYYVRNGASVAVMGRPYYVGIFPVTVAQYNLMLDPSAAVSETAENLRAVVNVYYATLRGSENVPAAFGGGLGDGPISRLNMRATAKLGPFDLPTESMWEVAARAIEAGNETHKTWPWFFGASDSLLSQYAFFNDSTEADAYGLTSGSRVPGGKLPNAWGFYDIYGNVWERCLDSCPSGQSSETESLSQTPQSAYTNFRNCGGSFANGSDRCRTSDGGGWSTSASATSERVGFRLAMISDEEIPTYTVTWCDYDGTVLATDKIAQALAGGVTPAYGNALPERPGHYCIGWSPSVVPLEGDTTYTALYKQSKSGRRLVDISALTEDYTARDGDVLTGKTTQLGIIIPDGATVTLSNAKIEPTNRYKIPILCQGDATVEIEDDSVNTLIAYSEYYTGSPGIAIGPSGKTLTINGDTGKLAVSGGRYAPGIGTRSQGGNGNVVVNGGDLTITSGEDSPGIGARDEGDRRGASCGGITINGGRLTVNGSQIGIGALNYSSCGTVAINGGELVVASGNLGIGGNCAGVAISGGTVRVKSDKASPAIGATGGVAISGGDVTATALSSWAQGAAGIGTGYSFQTCGRVSISGGTIVATGANGSSGEMSGGTGIGTCYGNCGNVTITGGHITATKGEYCPYDPIRVRDGEGYTVTIASGMKQTYSNDNKTLTIEPDVKETAVTVDGVAVGEVVRGEDGKTLSFAVAAGTVVGDVKLDIGGVDVTKGFRVTVNGTEATAVLLAPYEVPKEAGAADAIWTENGDGTVTLNVTVVPGLYYAADSAESIDALACPGASAPATGATTLTAPKPVGDKGFFKVWVSETPLKADD